MDTREQKAEKFGENLDSDYQEPGLGAWLKRNVWLLTRLFMVMVFTFGASTTAANFSYGLESKPVDLTVDQLKRGELPKGTEIGDYVRIKGTATPDFESLQGKPIGTEDSQVAVASRYSASYFYFGLEETGDSLLVQTAQGLPAPDQSGKSVVWEGKISTVGEVIFHDTTQAGLKSAKLPTASNVPIIETGDTPEYYRQIFPAYSAIIALWILSIAWLLWKKNKPFLGV